MNDLPHDSLAMYARIARSHLTLLRTALTRASQLIGMTQKEAECDTSEVLFTAEEAVNAITEVATSADNTDQPNQPVCGEGV